MPIFNDDATNRIRAVVKQVEGEPTDSSQKKKFIHLPPQRPIVFKVIGKIVGQTGRYTAHPFKNQPIGPYVGALTESDLGDVNDDVTINVWNLGELSGNPHPSPSIPNNAIRKGYLWNYGSPDDVDEKPVIVCHEGNEDSCVIVRVDSVASGGGIYYATIMGADSGTVSVTDNEAMPEGLSTVADCLLINTDENGQDTHLLKVDGTAYVIGYKSHLTTDADLPVVFTESVQGRHASPENLDGTSSTYNNDTKNYARHHTTSGDNLGGNPIDIKLTDRLFLKDTLPLVTLKEKRRELTHDASGRLWTASAEANHDIGTFPKFDTDDACTLLTQGNHTDFPEFWGFKTSTNQWVRICQNELDVVIGVFWNSSTGKLYYKKVTLYGPFGYSNAPTDVEILTAEPCEGEE